MIIREIPYRYAKALFLLATSDEQLAKWHKQLKELVELIKVVPQLRKTLIDPQVDRLDKEKILQKSFAGELDRSFLDYLFYLLEQGRFKYLAEIEREYHRIVVAHLEITEVTLVTAVPMSSKFKEQLKKKLEASYGKALIFYETVDPKIIGGVILTIADKIIDGSIRGRLARLKRNLLRARNVVKT